ncbi:MAG: glutamyl-Q tRNA(Asp) synthetase [Gammaproteobacteria bacterium]|nr:MAG: glutamyl-Q tRNA(Asp) synthetase [Gammaproteobacteria bacterium]
MPHVVGRFAPTPSGPLHLGSLFTAVASFLSARAAGGRWLLRLDDLDRDRLEPGAETAILRCLEAHGLHWDDAPIRQSARLPLYEAALARLAEDGLLYPCGCSRAQRRAEGRPGPAGPVYSGRCRDPARRRPGRALRLANPGGELAVDDALQGRRRWDLAAAVGDILLRRADGVIAYHLANVVDDAELGVSEVVRGADLLDSTPAQALLHRLLGLAPPRWLHLPVLTAADGRKLSKQNRAEPVDVQRSPANLARVLVLLGHPPPAALAGAPPAALLEWARQAWDPARLPQAETLVLDAKTPAANATGA